MTNSAGSGTEPYGRFDPADLILRDELALDRTALAIERTWLAWVRTALALILAGVTFIHFSTALWYTVLGAASVPVGLAVLTTGFRRYRRMQRLLAAMRLPPPHPERPG